MPSPTHVTVLVQPLSALSPRRLEWLWPGRLALGKLELLPTA
jgi:hypothetical protein